MAILNTKCGCKVTAHFRSSSGLAMDMEGTDSEWAFCPMHEAAPALMEALEGAYEKIRAYQKEYGNEYVGGPLLQILVPKIEAALAKGGPK